MCSPIHSAGEECGNARMCGFVLQAFSLDEYCKLYSQATGKSFNASVKKWRYRFKNPSF
ncbi:hypothetical protein [Acidianus ambivalens]|uniref:hypothetical protein n=1 Tax=Acidianus ambivalens TaxID=2283 RepID=UPI00128F5CA3|nr:hypothetical protein [Acidianus ambivalens]